MANMYMPSPSFKDNSVKLCSPLTFKLAGEIISLSTEPCHCASATIVRRDKPRRLVDQMPSARVYFGTN
jgi:hypothetical protein